MKKKRETFFAGYHFGMRKQIVKEFAKEASCRPRPGLGGIRKRRRGRKSDRAHA